MNLKHLKKKIVQWLAFEDIESSYKQEITALENENARLQNNVNVECKDLREEIKNIKEKYEQEIKNNELKYESAKKLYFDDLDGKDRRIKELKQEIDQLEAQCRILQNGGSFYR